MGSLEKRAWHAPGIFEFLPALICVVFPPLVPAGIVVTDVRLRRNASDAD